MVTARDLVEANAFGRRRLVTAFVAGAPGGREPEPARAGRTCVGGLVLAVLLLGGGAATELLGPPDPEEWARPGLVVSDETGEAYLVLRAGDHPTLWPVRNSTSARLALDAGELRPRVVAQEAIDEQVIGETVGISGAPTTLPAPSRLVQTGWSACAGGGLRPRVAASPGVRRVPGSGFVVTSRGVRYVVARAGPDGMRTPTARAYRLPRRPSGAVGDEQDTLLDELGLPIRDEATAVPARWLALFPPGGDLDWASFRLGGFGRPAPAAGSFGVPAGARVGDVLTTREESFLLTRRGPATLTAFALTVYRHVATPRGRLTGGPTRDGAAPLERRVTAAPSVGRAAMPYAGASWPASRPRPVRGRPCAELTTRVGAAPTVQIATDPIGEAGVAPGRGAYVRAGGWGGGARGAPVVVDATGVAHRVVGPDAADRLGYGGTVAPVVPVPWLDLFERGVPLSVDAALAGLRLADGS